MYKNYDHKKDNKKFKSSNASPYFVSTVNNVRNT